MRVASIPPDPGIRFLSRLREKREREFIRAAGEPDDGDAKKNMYAVLLSILLFFTSGAE